MENVSNIYLSEDEHRKKCKVHNIQKLTSSDESMSGRFIKNNTDYFTRV